VYDVSSNITDSRLKDAPCFKAQRNPLLFAMKKVLLK
jgi:hypothetical protein